MAEHATNESVLGGASEVQWCRAVLPRVSRTFALSIEALPETLREAVRIAYLLCRIVDTVEDQADLRPADRVELFDTFDAILDDDELADTGFDLVARRVGLDADGAEGELCQRASIVFRRFRNLPGGQRDAIRPHVAEMSVGMREFARRAEEAGKLRLEDVADLERYCYYVAGTVGRLLTALFEIEIPNLGPSTTLAARERAVSFGLGLQMVNIVKDVAADHVRGDCFLPLSLAAARGVSVDDLFVPSNRPSGLGVVRDVCKIARAHLVRAREYTLLWPVAAGRSIRMFCAVPLALALATLHEVEFGDQALSVGEEPKISRGAVLAIFAEAAAAIDDDERLGKLLDRCEQGGYR
jgi:farnesyl-diphosphate farnesyltransferase